MQDCLELIKNFYFHSPIYKNRTVPSKDLLEEISVSAKDNITVNKAIEFLAKSTLDKITHHFGVNLKSEESLELQEIAFIHFGQGTLFDDTFSSDTTTKTRRPLPFMEGAWMEVQTFTIFGI
jgi:hypothetical protein